jgi:hypothetical protein
MSHKGGEGSAYAGASYVLRPVVVWHQSGSCPFLAVRVGALASNEPIMGVLEDREP